MCRYKQYGAKNVLFTDEYINGKDMKLFEVAAFTGNYAIAAYLLEQYSFLNDLWIGQRRSWCRHVTLLS